MKTLASSIRKNSAVSSALALFVAACSSELTMSESVRVPAPVQFGAETALGNPGANASAPFLRASRPVLAFKDKQLQVAWTETDGESSRVVLRSAEVGR